MNGRTDERTDTLTTLSLSLQPASLSRHTYDVTNALCQRRRVVFASDIMLDAAVDGSLRACNKLT